MNRDIEGPVVVWTPPGWESALVGRIEELEAENETLRQREREHMLAAAFRALMGARKREVEHV